MDTLSETEISFRAKNDPAWKELMDVFFQDFVHYCLPNLAQLVDWQKSWQTLDPELHSLTKDAEIGNRFVDKLFKVFLKDGQEQWVLVHIEIQGAYYKYFAQRTFECVCRLMDKYKKPIASCAILTDENPNWRPNHYEMSFAGTCFSLEFSIVKIIDYRNQLTELENSSNPFGSVILIQLAALEAKNKSEKEKFNFKMALTRHLYKKGFNKETIIKLYYFIDWLISLPKSLEVEYQKECLEIEKGGNMAYVSTIEYFALERGFNKGIEQGMQAGLEEGRQKGMQVGLVEGRQEGLQEGRQEGLQEGRQEGLQEGRQEGEAVMLLRQVTKKFGTPTENYIKKILQADSDTLLAWSEEILNAKNLDEVFK